jgi:SpoVK/Ycf46/Vps4 family AAA+-type ATPase
MFIHLKEENKYVCIKYDSDCMLPNLQKGIYDVESVWGNYFFKENLAFTHGRVAKAGIFEQVSTYVDRYFSENGTRVRKAMSLQTRLGLFFKGEPGTGKTFLAAKLALQLIEKMDGIGVYTTKLDEFDMTDLVDAIRLKYPNRLVVFILDEFEKSYNNINREKRDNLLAFLDGGRSRDNVVVIATANSLDGIPPTLLQRPGRFEKVLEFRIKDEDVLNNLIDALVPEEFASQIEVNLLKQAALGEKNLTIDRLKSIVHDALTYFLGTGKLFPPEEEEVLRSISKEELEEEVKKNKGKKKKRSNPAYNFMKAMAKQAEMEEKEGCEEDCYVECDEDDDYNS